jgi:hypothetical protein
MKKTVHFPRGFRKADCSSYAAFGKLLNTTRRGVVNMHEDSKKDEAKSIVGSAPIQKVLIGFSKQKHF